MPAPTFATRPGALVALWLLACLLLACGGGTSGPEGGGQSPSPAGESEGLGQSCAGSCPRGLVCLNNEGFCSRQCDDDTDCGHLVCAASSQLGRACVGRCTHSLDLPHGMACVDGVPTSCEEAGPDADCTNCPCPQGMRCAYSAGCQPYAKVGEACKMDSECESGNCSSIAHVCRVPLHAPCDASNCDACMTVADWSSCSRECKHNGDCGGGPCTGFSGRFYCRRDCQGDRYARNCPEMCDYYSNRDGTRTYFCECSGCTQQMAPRELGQPCWGDADCTTRRCFGVGFCLNSDNECAEGKGACTTQCSTSQECAAGYRCALGNCLRECTAGLGESCPSGRCTPLSNTDESFYACDPRTPNGAGCVVNDECQSGSCAGTTCRGAAATGNSCRTDIDCAAGRCCSGICRTAC